MSIHLIRPTLPIRLRRRAVCTVVLAAMTVILSTAIIGCTKQEAKAPVKSVLVADQTGIVNGANAYADSWKAEAGSTAGRIFDESVSGGVDQIDIVTLGTNSAQAAKVASVRLDVRGNTEGKRDFSRRQLRGQFISAVEQVLSVPVETVGTDIATALQTAAGTCTSAGASCQGIWLLSDMEDTAVLSAPTDEAAIRDLEPRLPKLTGIKVTAIGVGASGSDPATVTRVRTIWPVLLKNVGAISIQLLRSY